MKFFIVFHKFAVARTKLHSFLPSQSRKQILLFNKIVRGDAGKSS